MKESETILDEAVRAMRSEPVAAGPGREVIDSVLSALPGGRGREAETAKRKAGIARRIRTTQRLTRIAAAAVIAVTVFLTVKIFTGPVEQETPKTVEVQEGAAKPGSATGVQAGAEQGANAKLEAELEQITRMFTEGDIDGLVTILLEGEIISKLFAAKYLGQVGDERALPVLEALYRLSKENLPEGYGQSLFAEAIARIKSRLEEEKRQAGLAEEGKDKAEKAVARGKTVRCKGIVTNGAGEAIEAVAVRSVVCRRTARYFWSLEPAEDDAETTTNSEGIFEIEARSFIDSENMRSILVFEAPEYATGWLDADLMSSKDDVRVRLFEPTVVTGVVADEDGEAIKGAVVSMKPKSPSYHLAQQCALTVATSDADGRFVIDKVAEGAMLQLNVMKEGYVAYTTHTQGDSYPIGAGQEDLLITLKRGGVIRGHLVSGGQPYEKAGMVVRVYGQGFDNWTTTDEGGGFEVAGLSEGSYTVAAYNRSTFKISAAETESVASAPKNVEVSAGAESTVTLELQEGLPVTVQIVNAETGEPVSNQRFQITSDASDGAAVEVAADITNAEGQGVVNLASGEYVVKTESWEQGQYTEVSQALLVESGSEGSIVEISVIPRPMIRGTLTDAEGEPVGGYLWFEEQKVSTDEHGSFEVPEPPGAYPKAYTCYAFDDEAVLGRALRWEETDAGWIDSQPEWQIVLEPLATIVGRAVDETGQGVGDVEIGIFMRRDGSGHGEVLDFAEVKVLRKTTEADGWFRLEGVPAGPAVLLQVSKDDFAGVQELQELQAGQVVEVGEILLSEIPKAEGSE